MASSGAKKSRSEAASNGVLVCVEKLREAQEELAKINGEEKEKKLAIEKKYNKLKNPVLVKRNEIINKTPNFWLTSFWYHTTLSQFLTMEDRKIFRFIDSLHVESFNETRKGYCIVFNFKPNPYFENLKLSKTIILLDNGTMTSVGTTIDWKEGMAPAVGSYANKGNRWPTFSNSFFTWFGPHPGYLLGTERDSVAEIIKEELWANPIEHLYCGTDSDTDSDYDIFEDSEDEELEELKRGGSSQKN